MKSKNINHGKGVKLIINRTFFCENHMSGNFLILNKINNVLFSGVTLELPYLNNKKNISAIPDGLYSASLLSHSKFGQCIYFHSVIGRSGIFIHKANFVREIEGCIIVGSSFAGKKEIYSVNSAVTLALMHQWLAKQFLVTVSSCLS